MSERLSDNARDTLAGIADWQALLDRIDTACARRRGLRFTSDQLCDLQALLRDVSAGEMVRDMTAEVESGRYPCEPFVTPTSAEGGE